MKMSLRAFAILCFLLLFICVHIARGESGPPGASCPESCESSRKNCELSCSQIVGGGVESGKKRECYDSCANEEAGCNEECLNPTPRPGPEPEPYGDRTCAGACEFRGRDCMESCTRFVGGGAASAERLNCEKGCGEVLAECRSLCADQAPPPAFDPGVYENNPCSEACASGLGECEGNCSMFSGDGEDGGKRGECMSECKTAEYDCLSSCPR